MGRFYNYVQYDDITYEVYCGVISGNINEGIFDDIKGRLASFAKILSPIKEFIERISTDFKVGIDQVVKAFQQRDVFGLLKAIRFNLTVLIRSITEAGKMFRAGLLKVFEEIHKSQIIQQIKKGTKKIDDLLDKYPLLKKVAGIAVAGILIYIWLNMTFVGDFDYDFNLGDVILALKGSFSITDMFMSPSGIMMIALFFSGSLISFPWLGKTLYNVVLAVFYTGYSKLKDKDNRLMSYIKSKIGK